MNTIELIKDAAFFGGNIPNERLKECRDFFDNVIEKQCIIPVVMCSLCESIKDCGDLINKPIECGSCGVVHTN